MDKAKVTFTVVLVAIAALAFGAGVLWSIKTAKAEEPTSQRVRGTKPAPRVVYPQKTDLEFEGTHIQGEIKNPGEFYFQHREEEKFDSLVKRRYHFHREMLRDVVLSK